MASDAPDSRPLAGRRGRLSVRGGVLVLVLASVLVGASSAWGSSTSADATRAVGAWRLLPAAPIRLEAVVSSVWTGREMLLRLVDSDERLGSVVANEAYDPATDGWRRLPDGPGSRLAAQGQDSSVWSGREWIVLGPLSRASAYNPRTNRWRRLASADDWGGSPTVVAWTGSQMIVWGGGCCGERRADGLAYTLATDTWRRLPPAPLAARHGAASAWTGKELVIVGGMVDSYGDPTLSPDEFRTFADAAAYNPTSRTWRRLPPLPAPRTGATAEWDGHQVLVVGGIGPASRREVAKWGAPTRLRVGVFGYRPVTNRWQRLRSMPRGRDGQVGVWTGNRLLVWGGWTVRNGRRVYPRTGLIFDPVRNRWSPLLPAAPLRGGYWGIFGVWTGRDLIVSGKQKPRSRAEAASYTPPPYVPARSVPAVTG